MFRERTVSLPGETYVYSSGMTQFLWQEKKREKIFRISDEISKVAPALMQFPEKILGSTSLVSRFSRRGLIPKIT